MSKDLEKRYQYVQGNEYKKAAREGKFLNNEQLAKKYKLTVSQIERAIAKIKQETLQVYKENKYNELIDQLLLRKGSILVFVKTKRNAEAS